MPYPTTSTTKVEPDGPTRREVLKQLALAVTAAGTASFNLEAARVVHEITNNTKIQTGTYTPVSLSAQQFRAISRLADVIIPPGGEIPQMERRASRCVTDAQSMAPVAWGETPRQIHGARHSFGLDSLCDLQSTPTALGATL